MKSLRQYISDCIAKVYNPDREYVLEMAQAGRNVKLGKTIHDLAIHGTYAGDRPYPHLHIYKIKGDKSFDFEISLVDLLCDDEINLVSMKDKSSNINRRNRNICSWEGYRTMLNDLEDWFEEVPKRPGGSEFTNNIDYCVWLYNDESGGDEQTNPFLEYIKGQGKKIHELYKDLSSFEGYKEKYKECF